MENPQKTQSSEPETPLVADMREAKPATRSKFHTEVTTTLWRYRPRLKHVFLLVFTVFLCSVLLVLPLRWFAPATTAFMLSAKQEGLTVHYEWVDLEQMPPMVLMSVIAAEDQKFPQHAGFDFESIQKALTEKRQRRRGASTLSQQLAKNLFLWSGRSYTRKGLEVYFTVLIELLLPKSRILELYLNTAEFAPGLFGVGAGSQHLLKKQAKYMSTYECSLFAAVLPNPKRFSIARPSNYVQKRAASIRKSIRQLGGARYLQSMNVSY